ncbi:MAG: hypothetical protein M3Q77_09930 [Thermoproteota archaeon]|nr:hypothetical protein [Thermoproteota archaeon]
MSDTFYHDDSSYQFIKSLQNAWYEFVVKNTEIYEKTTETSFDIMCRYACEVMKPMALDMARNYAKNLERERIST